jgi:uncharacterized membrane protein
VHTTPDGEELMMEEFRGAALVAATITLGLSAGLFAAFSYAVMPGLNRADDRSFVEVMQRINVAILNPWFAICFLGALVLTALATVLQFGADRRPALPWLLAGLVLYVVVLAVTFAVNVPLNNALAEAGDADRIADLAAVRERFEAAWVRWNVVRAVLAVAAFGCVTWALLLYGRVTG